MTRLFINLGVRYLSLDIVRLLNVQISHSQNITTKCLLRCVNSRSYASNKGKFTSETRVATLDAFSQSVEKTKDTYLDLLHFYKKRDIHRRGHVEFIYTALKYMKEFGVHKDLETYKSLIDVMPKGKFVAQNVMQAEFQHYPKQQQCLIDLLEQMEENSVCPDEDMEDILINTFGRRSHVIRRYWRMMYWMPKLKYASPWLVPESLPDDSLELAKFAIKRITSVDPATEVTVLETKEVKDSIDDTWIVSGQSPNQQELIEKHDKTRPLYVEGSFRVWLRSDSVNYFVLRADPDPTPRPKEDPDDVSNLSIPLFSPPKVESRASKTSIVHEQEDSVIMCVCATGSSSRDSLLSWIRLLQKTNPKLGEIPVLFTLKSPIGLTEPIKEIEGDSPVPSVVTDIDKEKEK